MGHLKNYQKKHVKMRWPWEPFAEECKTKMREGGDTHLFYTFFIFLFFLAKSVWAPDYTITRLQLTQATEILAGMACCNRRSRALKSNKQTIFKMCFLGKCPKRVREQEKTTTGGGYATLQGEVGADYIQLLSCTHSTVIVIV